MHRVLTRPAHTIKWQAGRQQAGGRKGGPLPRPPAARTTGLRAPRASHSRVEVKVKLKGVADDAVHHSARHDVELLLCGARAGAHAVAAGEWRTVEQGGDGSTLRCEGSERAEGTHKLG